MEQQHQAEILKLQDEIKKTKEYHQQEEMARRKEFEAEKAKRLSLVDKIVGIQSKFDQIKQDQTAINQFRAQLTP